MTKIGVDFNFDKLDRPATLEEYKGEVKTPPCVAHDKQTELDLAFERLDQVKLKAFDSGALREDKTGKSRPSLISPYFTERLGFVLAKGANLHGDRNWEKGLPNDSTLDSLERHIMAYKMSLSKGYSNTSNTEGDDHLAQAAFNLMVLIHNEEIKKIDEVDKEARESI